MAGLRGNTAWLMAKKQTGRGSAAVAAATGTFKSPFAGGNIAPTRTTDALSETDSSRDRGVSFVSTSGVEGTPEIYVRDTSLPFWLHAALGNLSTGTAVGGVYPHTVIPSGNLPYLTVWRNISDTLYERFEDCKVDGLTISAEAGSPLTAAVSLTGRRAVRETTDPSIVASTPLPLDNSAVYNFNDASVTLAGGATALVRSFELGIANNVASQQTDDVVPYDVVEGVREVSLGFDLIFEDLTEYNKFHYGGASGTAVSSDIYTTAAVFTFTKGDNSISFSLPRIAYEEFPVEPNTGGDPITVSVRAVAQRGSTPVLTAVVNNTVASYA